MGNLATSIDERLLDVGDDRVRRSLILEPNDGRLLLVDGESARQDGQSSNDGREELHDD